jgi:predicted dehydrogenase
MPVASWCCTDPRKARFLLARIGVLARPVRTRNIVTRPLRAALVGCGRWGSCIAKTLDSLAEYDLAWVCDPEVRWPTARWAKELTSDVCREVEVVLIATPPEHHVAPALLALANERAVFVEKPFALSATEALHIANARGNTPLMAGHLLVFHPLYHKLQSELAAGKLGDVRTIDVTRHSPARGTARCPWWTLAPHDLSLLVRLLGAPQHMNVELASNGRDVTAKLTWEQSRARLDYSTCATTKRRSWRVETSRCTLDLDEQLAVWNSDGRKTRLPEKPPPLTLELLHFARCVAHGETPTTGIEDALTNVELLCWGQLSLSRSARQRSEGSVQDGLA